MKKTFSLWGLVIVVSLVSLTTPWLFPKEASAVPAFARQMGMACNTCHFQHFPALNAFGRIFKMNGYVPIGSQGKVEGNGLSIPDTLNASLVTKIRYQKSNGDSEAGKDQGQLQFPDEGALLIGGRVGEKIGFLLEMQLADEGSPAFASFKMPFVFDVRNSKLQIIPFTTDAGGSSYGFELLNTGANRMQRILEDRNTTSAQQYIGTSGEAEGVALVAANNMGFINATLWGPVHGNMDAGLRLSQYLRIAATPTLGNWDTGFGAQYWGGKTKVGDTDAVPAQIYETKAWAVDAQGQGTVGSLPLGVYLSYANAAKDDDGAGGETNFFNNGNPDDKTAWSLTGELGILPGKATVALGYRGGDNGSGSDSSDNALVLGATYTAAQNVVFQINHALYSGDAYDPKPATGGDQLTTLMMFGAF
ncbi:MAG: hypothetical protein HZA19_01640 [Nitrospirae bacterium]|nr:hypothetical protein [Nitrospirota bacterium]